MDAFQKQRAEVALRRLDSEKSIKKYKLDEHFANVRLSLLLHLPYAVIKMHHNCRMSVCNETGLVRFQFPDDYISIREYLKRDDSPTFDEWLSVHYPEEFKRYQSDKFTYLFGYGATTLKYRDAVQVLYDEFDKFTLCRNEQERRYYFSSLLQDADIDSMNEFDLFGCADGSHSPQEVQDFKRELLDMKRAYNEHPERFFHPADDLGADADSTRGDSMAAVM
jgi:hypothetical protein